MIKKILKLNDMLDNTMEVFDWILNNKPTIENIVSPANKHRIELLNEYEPIFHDEINEQFDEMVTSLIGIEVCICLGCSVEDFYEAMEDRYIINLLKEMDIYYD